MPLPLVLVQSKTVSHGVIQRQITTAKYVQIEKYLDTISRSAYVSEDVCVKKFVAVSAYATTTTSSVIFVLANFLESFGNFEHAADV